MPSADPHARRPVDLMKTRHDSEGRAAKTCSLLCIAYSFGFPLNQQALRGVAGVRRL